MMKKAFNYFVICLFVFLGTNVVNAESEYITNVSANEYNVKTEAETGKTGSKLYIYLNGTNSELENSNNIHYFGYFVNSPSEKVSNIVENGSGCVIDPTAKTNKLGDFNVVNLLDKSKNDNSGVISVTEDWYLASGYEYVYIIKLIDNESDKKYHCEITDNPIKLDKPELPSVENRYKIYLFDDNSSVKLGLNVFNLFPFGRSEMYKYGTGKMVTKIGLINDDNVLNKFRSGSSDRYSNLLQYAKKSEGKTWEYNDYSNASLSIDNFDVVNGAYYYVFTTYNDPDGIYRNMDGISIVMGADNRLVNDVKFNDDSKSDDRAPKNQTSNNQTPENNNKINNPSTGVSSICLAFLALVLSLISLLFFGKKQKS